MIREEARLFKRQGWDQLRLGHPWVRRDHLNRDLPVPPVPAAVHLGEHWFLHSPQSRLVLRRLGPADRHWNWTAAPIQQSKGGSDPLGIEAVLTTPEEFDQRLGAGVLDICRRAILLRRQLLPNEECWRAIFSENDGLPGLIVDRYGPTLVAQILTSPIESFWPVIKLRLIEAFQEVIGLRPELVELRTASVRRQEGLLIPEAQEDPNTKGEWLKWNGFEWWMTPGGAQKTGAFLDQRDNHRRAASWGEKFKALKAWDVCAYQGGFALHLARAGLAVDAIDASTDALNVLEKNGERNSLGHLLTTKRSDAFQFLREKHDQQEKVDMIVLDPPGFAKSRREKEGALRGFKELNLRALHCLKPGGILVSCSCSQAVSRADFMAILRSAAHDARRGLRVLEVGGPSLDHAPLISFPEGEYLQAWFLIV